MTAEKNVALKRIFSGKIVVVVVVLSIAVLCLAVLAGSMSKKVGRDEQMYCTAGVLMSQGKMIYRDFSYPSQMPCHALLYAVIFRLSGTSHYLLAGRMVSVVCNIAVILCIVGVYRSIFKSFSASGMVLGLAAAVLYIFNPFVDYSNGYAWNHDVVMACVILSFWLYITMDFKGKLQYGRLAAIGVLLTLAACMRITTVLVELVFLGALLKEPANSLTERFYRLLPFFTAAAVVLAWPVWIVSNAPQAFYLNLIKIPTLYGQWLAGIGMVHNKYHLMTAGFTTPGYIVLFGMVVYLSISTLVLRRRVKISNGRNLCLAGMLVVTFIVIMLIPPTMWRQYLAMPVPFLVIALAYPLLSLRKMGDNCGIPGHFKIACILTAVCVLVAVVSNPVVLSRIPVAFAPQTWEPVEMHKIARDIGQRVKVPKRVLTLGPLYALEAGCDIYPELSAGAIIYRVGDFLTPAERALTHTVGCETLKEILENAEPSAVILGAEPAYFAFLEEPLKKATRTDWESKAFGNGLVTYYKNKNQLIPNQ